MKYFIFRNYTIEPLFRLQNAVYSGYEDVYVNSVVDRYLWFYCVPYKVEEVLIADEIDNYIELLKLALSKVDSNKMFVIFTMDRFYHISYRTSDRTVQKAIERYNNTLWEIAVAFSNVRVVDFSLFTRQYPSEELVDWKFFFVSQMPVNPKLAIYFNSWFEREIEIIELRRKKCIVLDLDNTLWGGILGEDGIDGIKMGESYPGGCYHYFQQYLLNLSNEGILLAICSKNNEADVHLVWERHPDLLIRRENIVSYRINWNNKAENIAQIAHELNLGLDSLVFIDDNPAERELVRQVLPQVAVPDFPSHPYLFPQFVRDITRTYFSVYQLTVEDINKTQQYKENVERAQFKDQFVDFNTYLKSLKIELSIEPLNDFTLTRFAQMTQKTNQFNLTTRRYTEADINQFVADGNYAYGLRVKDRFGDNGLTGLIMVKIDNTSAIIDTFLLSCRILGKNIEIEFVNRILDILKRDGIITVYSQYIKTMKNGQVEQFWDKIGFIPLTVSEEKREYYLELNDFESGISNFETEIKNERKN